MMYGFPRVIRGNSLMGELRWDGATNPLAVAESMTSPLDMCYGFGGSDVRMAYPEFSTIPAVTVSDGYSAVVLHTNGRIYHIPDSATSVAEYDPVADTVSYFGSLSATSGKWRSGILAPNGKIYCAPFVSINWLEIDVVARTATVLSNTLSAFYGPTILANNGIAFGIPNDSSSGNVTFLNTLTKAIGTFGSTGTVGYESAVLGPDGRIYCIPWASGTTNIGIIDPINMTFTLGPSVTPGSSNSHWRGAVMAPNGKIYFIPSSATNVIEYEPLSGTVKTIGTVSASTLKWRGGFLGPDGCIYGIPHSQSTMLKINPYMGTVEEFGSLSGSSKWSGAVMTQNGVAYTGTARSDTILKIDFKCQINRDCTLSKEYNKF